MSQHKRLPYEEGAEHMTGISGWVCKACRRFWGENEHIARYCCAATRKCETQECAGRADAHGFVYCDKCMEKRDLERWLKLEEVAWDGETPLCLDHDDRYFFSADDLAEYLFEEETSPEDVRLRVCEREHPPYFEVNEFLSDHLPDGLDLDGDGEKLDRIVNAWIKKHAPDVWVPGKKRPSPESIKTHTTYIRG